MFICIKLLYLKPAECWPTVLLFPLFEFGGRFETPLAGLVIHFATKQLAVPMTVQTCCLGRRLCDVLCYGGVAYSFKKLVHGACGCEKDGIYGAKILNETVLRLFLILHGPQSYWDRSLFFTRPSTTCLNVDRLPLI